MNIFTSKNRKKIKWVWGVIGVLVILSMIVLYSGIPTFTTLR